VNFINRSASGSVATPGHRQRRRRARAMVLCAIAPIAAALAPTAGAAVQLSGVASGTATVSQKGSVTTIKTSNNAILNFSQFNIAAGSTVDFLQPSVASRVLDQINSASPSRINGSLLSNGSVYLINPAGVIFGPGSVVNVNDFYVAGSHMSNQDFLNNVNHFSSVSGIVSNSGQINANQVYLVGSQVINQGSIVSPNGVVAMLAGSDVVVGEPGSHVTATVVPVASPTGGSTQLDLRTSALAAGDAYSLAIRHTGSIQASTVLINGGQGQVQVSGTINASSQTPGTTGGNVSITGGEVDLVAALINASGPAGGGSVLIGGGPHGGGSLAQATDVSLDGATVINADATTNGAGGTIVLWSNGNTTDSAVLTARGGPLGGNGGYVETSGELLQVNLVPLVSAPDGKAGNWVIDPPSIEIINGADMGTSTFTGSTTITNGTIETALEAGDNVLITTNQTGGISGTLIQDSTAPINVTLSIAPVTLQLQSGSDMTLQGGITATGSGSNTLNVELDQLNGSANNIIINTNPINVNGTINIVGGIVTLTSVGLTGSAITIGTGTPTGGSGSLTTGAVILNGPVTSTSGNISIGPSGADSVGGAIVTNGSNFSATGSSFTSTSAGTITTTGGTVTLTDTGAITVGGTVNTGGASFTATGTGFTNNATISDGGSGSTASALSINTSTGTGTIDINGTLNWTAGTGRNITVEGGGAITVTSVGSLDAAGGSALPIALYTTGSGSAVTLTGTVNTTGNFSSDGGNFSVTSPSSPTTIITASSISINNVTTTPDSKSVTDGSVTISGPVTTSGNAFSAGGTGGFTSNSTGTITTGGGDVIISNSGAITIDAPVTTGGGSFTQTSGSSFASNTTGTITTGGGGITLQDFGQITNGGIVNTGGGNYSATGTGFETDAALSDGGSGSGSNSLAVNTSSGTGAITINGAVHWTSGFGRSIAFEGGGNINVTVNGSVDSTGTGLPVSFYTTGSGASVTLTGTIDTTGAFISDGGNFSISAPSVATTVILTAQSININTGTLTPDNKPITDGSVTISGPVVTTGGDFDAGGTGGFTTNSFGTITTSADNGNVNISNTGAVSISDAISTGSGAFTATLNSSFNTGTSGTITTTNGAVTIGSTGVVTITNNIVTGGGDFTASGQSFSMTTPLTTGGGNVSVTTTTGGISFGNTVNTGGGSFTAVGASFTETGTITDGGITTGSPSYSVNTSSGTSPITVSEPINFPVVTLEGGGNVSIATNGAIDATGAVSLYTTGSASSITITGPVTTNGAFIADGGSVTITAPAATIAPTPEPVIVSASTVNINTATLTPDGKTMTLNSVFIEGPVVTHGDFDAGGTTSLVSNEFGTITTNGGAVNITNTGLIGIGEPITTAGGNFTATAGTGFSNSASGSITTGGGNVLLAASTSSEIDIGVLINTGGGSFTATAEGMQITSTITDGGVGTGSNSLSINTSSGTDPITNNGSTTSVISWTGGSGRTVTIEGGGNITLNEIAATGTTPLPISLYSTANGTADVITITTVTGNGPFISSGQGFTLASGGTLTATSVNINTLSTSPDSKTLTPGAVVISGAIISSGTLTIDGTSAQVASTGAVTTNGGAFTIDSTGVVTIEGPVTSDGGAINLTSGASFTSDSNGALTSAGGDISIQGSTGVTINATVNTGGGNFTAAGTTFTNSAEISDGGVNDSKAQGLTIIASSGDININGEISWAASSSPITMTVGSTHTLNIGASIIANSLEPINFTNTAVNVTSSSLTISGGNITFGSLTNSATDGGAFTIAGSNIVLGNLIDATTPNSDNVAVTDGGGVIIQSSSTVSLQEVGTQAIPFGELIITNNNTAAQPTTTLHGNIWTIGTSQGAVEFAGSVILPQNIQIADIDTNTDDTSIIEFDGAIEGPGGLTVILPTHNFGQIRINNNVGDVTPLAFLNLFPGNSSLVGFRWGTNSDPNGVGLQQPATTIDIADGGDFEINDVRPSVRSLNTISLFATLDSYGPLTINIGSASTPDAANTYAVGQNEKLTVYGSLTINTNGGSITTGDISTLNNMTLEASAINFLLRDPTLNVNDTGETTAVLDSGVDYIAGGEMSLPGNAKYTAVSGDPDAGSFDVPGFIAQSYSSTSNIATIASEMKTAFSFVGGLSPSVIFGADNFLLDLTPNTLTTSVPNFVPPTPFVFDYPIAGAVPRVLEVAGTVPLDFKIAYPPAVAGPIVQEDLKDAGLYTQDPNLEEIMGAVDTMAVYDDMPDRPRPRSVDYKVVVNRLDFRRLGSFLDAYHDVFGDDPAASRTLVSTSIQGAWDAYVTQNGDQPVSGAGFAQYCANTPSAAGANTALRQLHGLRYQLGTLGLSYKEAQVAFQYNVLTGLSAIGMREGDLATAIAATPAPKN
jgi:filamentous hemagglutinin family protein